ncbi:MAG TPA: hypothetical protein VJR47_16810 [Stellaceae bacterium]|nr:hypothetical protein [Stellaceae bacterium]
MDALLKVAAPVLVELVRMAQGGDVAKRGALAGGFAFAALLLALAAIGCAIAALWIYMIPLIGPGAAPLVCVGALLILLGICLLVCKSLFRQRSRGSDALLQCLGQLDPSGFFSEHKATLLIAALVLGLIAGSGSGAGGKRPR